MLNKFLVFGFVRLSIHRYVLLSFFGNARLFWFFCVKHKRKHENTTGKCVVKPKRPHFVGFCSSLHDVVAANALVFGAFILFRSFV